MTSMDATNATEQDETSMNSGFLMIFAIVVAISVIYFRYLIRTHPRGAYAGSRDVAFLFVGFGFGPYIASTIDHIFRLSIPDSNDAL